MLDKPGKPAGAGALFGLAVIPADRSAYFVNDATHTLNIVHA